MDKAILTSQSVVNGCYIIGCVFERFAKKEKNNQFHNYKIQQILIHLQIMLYILVYNADTSVVLV